MSRAQWLRFWTKVSFTSSCWLWTANQNGRGYGRVVQDGASRPVHRVAFEEFNGQIPEGMEIDHLCKVRHCVNPAHLRVVTHLENVRAGDGAWMRQAQLGRSKTHCNAAHEFTPENTWIRKNGTRQCRQCRRDATNRCAAKKREAWAS